MPILYIMCGVGFSGKSTLSKKIAEYFDIPLVGQDALFFEKEKELNLDQDDEKQWRMLLEMCKERIRGFLIDGKSVVFDNVNLKKKHREELRNIAKAAEAKAVVIYLATPEKVLNERQKRNKITKEHHEIKQEYLDMAKRDLEIPSEDENAFVFSPKTGIETFLKKLPR